MSILLKDPSVKEYRYIAYLAKRFNTTFEKIENYYTYGYGYLKMKRKCIKKGRISELQLFMDRYEIKREIGCPPKRTIDYLSITKYRDYKIQIWNESIVIYSLWDPSCLWLMFYNNEIYAIYDIKHKFKKKIFKLSIRYLEIRSDHKIKWVL